MKPLNYDEQIVKMKHKGDKFDLRLRLIKHALVYEGREHPFEAEHVIFVPPDKEHRFKNTGRSLLRMLCIIPTAVG